MNGFDHWALGLAVFLPLIGAGVMTCVPRRFERHHTVMALVTTALTLLVGIYIAARFDYDNAQAPQFEVQHSWISVINSNYHVFLDGISLPLLLMSMLITLLCVIYSWSHLPEPRNGKALFILMLLLETGINGAFVAQDLILFFVFFELVLLPMYFLVGVWGGPRRQYASLKFFVYTFLGSAFMLLGFLALYFLGDGTFDIPAMAAANSATHDIAQGAQIVVFLAIFVGFAVKVPIFPFHTWMPDAHTEAPTVASVLLASVMLKLGGYGFIRIALPILPNAAKDFAPYIGALAAVAIIYGALGCLAQHDMKRLIAFSSLAHMGFVMLGISTLTTYGINAAIFAMVAHGLITGMLFFLAGSVQHRLHTRELDKFGGLLSVAPHLTWILGFCAMASLGMPGLAGFWGEFSAILSAFNPAPGLSTGAFRTYMVMAGVGTVLAAGYLLWMYSRIAFGQPSEHVREAEVTDAKVSEYVAWAPLLILIVVLGIFPGLLFEVSNPAVTQLTSVFGTRP